MYYMTNQYILLWHIEQCLLESLVDFLNPMFVYYKVHTVEGATFYLHTSCIHNRLEVHDKPKSAVIDENNFQDL